MIASIASSICQSKWLRISESHAFEPSKQRYVAPDVLASPNNARDLIGCEQLFSYIRSVSELQP